MFRHLVTLLQHHFSMEDIRIELLADHTANNDSKVYSIQASSEKYVLKEMLPDDSVKDEGNLIAHLLSKGIKVPKIYHTNSGDATFIHDGFLYILYEFIEGTAFDLNTAPPWALNKSAQTLGQIHSALYDYKEMPLEIDQEAFAALWSFAPPYDDLPREYQQIASLTDNLASWLYDHVDDFADDLIPVR